MKFVRDVQEFQDKFGIGYDGEPRHEIGDELATLRVARLHEEVREYDEALRHGTLADALDALIDLVYIAGGAVGLHGLAEVFDEGWDRVHAANMAKERAAPDGSNSKHGSGFDIIKPAGWTAPDLRDLVDVEWEDDS